MCYSVLREVLRKNSQRDRLLLCLSGRNHLVKLQRFNP